MTNAKSCRPSEEAAGGGDGMKRTPTVGRGFNDAEGRETWVRFACEALGALVTEQKQAFGPHTTPSAFYEVADEAGCFANAMFKVWGETWEIAE